MSLKKVNAALIMGYQALNLDLPTYYETRDDRIGDAHPSGHFARVHLIPAERAPITLGENGHDEYNGVFQIDFEVPENTGTAALHDYADVTCDYFLAGQTLVYLGQPVHIRRASPSPVRKGDGGTFAISVSVFWRARVQRGTLATGGTTIPDGTTTGGDDYEFIQSSPSSTWTINHNLGRRVDVSVFTSGGQQVIADVHNVSLNQTVINFASPMAGYAIIN